MSVSWTLRYGETTSRYTRRASWRGGQLEGRCAYAWASEVGAMSAAVVAASHGRAVGDMNDVVRSGVIRALPAETIGANGAMMRRCGTGSCCGDDSG